ncbi:hypothetical protein FSOLCH5_009957 [Fusarium solani]
MAKQVLDLEREGIGLKEIKAKIRSVPQELDALYCELIRSMGSDSLKLIQWICFATRPLSLDELRWAMLVEVDCPHRSLYECQSAGDYPSDDDVMKRRIQTLSCGLAEVILSSGDGDEDLSEPDSSSRSIDSSIRTEVTPSSHAQVVQFIHQSVKDFFVEKGLSALDWPKWIIPFIYRSAKDILIEKDPSTLDDSPRDLHTLLGDGGDRSVSKSRPYILKI